MAKQFEVVVAHQLSTTEALARVHKLLADLRNIYSTQIGEVREEWQGNVCRFSLKMFVFRISGTITVGSNAVEVRGKMPLGTAKYENNVRTMIQQRATALLAVKPPPMAPPLQPPSLW